MTASLAARGVILSAVAVLSFSGAGCATKKHVRNVVAPIEARLGDEEKKTAANSQSINQLETNVSRVDEKATDAGRKASAAGEDAARANQSAQQAGQQAADARGLAEKGLNETSRVRTDLSDRIENLDNYQMVSNETVHFGFNKSILTKDGKEQLDQMVQNMSSMKHYIVEVEGFTDKTGPIDYNLELSRKRANAVVRYLTVDHNIPLRRIHVLGVGEEKPVNEGRTRAARQENRRVEVKVYALSTGGNTSSGMQSSADRSTPATTQPVSDTRR